MRRLTQLLLVLMAAAWLPTTLHCQLESIPGLEFLACQSDRGPQSDQASDCADTECCSAEKAPYKSESNRPAMPSPQLLPVAVTLLLVTALPDEASRDACTVAPPELPKGWQFVFRTASPPRAPSFAS